MELPKKITDVQQYFGKLPGIGEKTALRHVLNMLNWDQEKLSEFSKALDNLADLGECVDCGMLCDAEKCSVCTDQSRYQMKSICVVEGVTDYIAIENSGHFTGLIHILGGVLNPLLGVGPDELNLDRLVSRVTENDIEEVVLALNPSVEGDATSSYIKEVLPENVKVDRIGFGIPMGGSLEYLDSMTISKALDNRKMM